MRRKTLLLVIIVLLFSIRYACAETEITFQGIPWLSDEEAVFEELSSKGFVRKGINIPLFNEGAEFIVEDEGFIYSDIIVGVEKVSFTTQTSDFVKGRIGGYPVNNIKLSFAYDGEYKLIYVKVTLINPDFSDVIQKLNMKYGEEEHLISNEGIESFVWKGSNNSCILIYTQDEGMTFDLIYGRLDAADILQNCLAPADPDDVSGL